MAEHQFAADPYITHRAARSLLCLPLITQAKLIGVLYLENNLAPRVFVPARTAVLKLLASQAAIALEIARLHNDLAEREARIRRLVEANLIPMFVGDRDGGIVEANEAFLRLVGYGREDLVAGRLRWTDLTPPEWRDRDKEAIAELNLTGRLRPFEKEYLRKDGSRVPVLLGAAALEDSSNEAVAFVLDLTERKRAEDELRESEERFRALVQFSFDVYWESDAQHRFIRQEFAEGLADAPAPGSEIGKTRWEVPYLEPDSEAWRKHRETLDAHLPFRDFEIARPSPDGGKRLRVRLRAAGVRKVGTFHRLPGRGAAHHRAQEGGRGTPTQRSLPGRSTEAEPYRDCGLQRDRASLLVRRKLPNLET